MMHFRFIFVTVVAHTSALSNIRISAQNNYIHKLIPMLRAWLVVYLETYGCLGAEAMQSYLA